MVFVVLLQNQCKTRQILISGNNADHRNIRSNFQKPVDFICQNFHLFDQRFNKISTFFCRPLQIFASPTSFLGTTLCHPSKPSSSGEPKPSNNYLSSHTSMKRISEGIYCGYDNFGVVFFEICDIILTMNISINCYRKF